jgi:hypothetical protein
MLRRGALSVRSLSTSYKGSSPAKFPQSKPNVSFTRARAEHSARRTGKKLPTFGASREAVVLRRDEGFAERHIGPLAGVNTAGALLFCGVVIKEGIDAAPDVDGSVEPAEPAPESESGAVAMESSRNGRIDPNPVVEIKDRDLRRFHVPQINAATGHGPSTMQRALVVSVALLTAAGVIFSASRLTRRRLVELRVVAGDTPVVRLYTRKMLGGSSLSLAREAVPTKLSIDFGRLRAAAAERQNELIRKNGRPGEKIATKMPVALTAKSGDHPAFFSFALLPEEGDRGTGRVDVFTVDARQLSILDVQAIEHHSVDSRAGVGV